MARVEIAVKYCDACRGKTEARATRFFEWFGTKYSIDVCEQHDAGLHAALDKWLAVATTITSQLTSVSPIAAPGGLYERPVPLPRPSDRWIITKHARQRMIERQVSEAVAREVAENPDTTGPSRKEARLTEHYGKGLVVVVDRNLRTIVTVVGEQQIAVG